MADHEEWARFVEGCRRAGVPPRTGYRWANDERRFPGRTVQRQRFGLRFVDGMPPIHPVPYHQPYESAEHRGRVSRSGSSSSRFQKVARTGVPAWRVKVIAGGAFALVSLTVTAAVPA